MEDKLVDKSIKDIEYNGITYSLLDENIIIDKNTSEEVGILKEDNTIVFFNTTI